METPRCARWIGGGRTTTLQGHSNGKQKRLSHSPRFRSTQQNDASGHARTEPILAGKT